MRHPFYLLSIFILKTRYAAMLVSLYPQLAKPGAVQIVPYMNVLGHMDEFKCDVAVLEENEALTQQSANLTLCNFGITGKPVLNMLIAMPLSKRVYEFMTLALTHARISG